MSWYDIVRASDKQSGLREYNPEQDYIILVKISGTTDKSLYNVMMGLYSHGIRWPWEYWNRGHGHPIDQDICRSWGV